MEEEKKQPGEARTEINKSVALLFLFIISFAVLFALSLGRNAIAGMVGTIPFLNLFLPLPAFDSPMYYLLPIAGFFFTYYIIDWANKYFETMLALSPLFLLLIVILSLLAFYIALFWLAAETSRFAGRPVEFDFWGELRQSAFYLFMLSCVLGWVSRKIIEKI